MQHDENAASLLAPEIKSQDLPAVACQTSDFDLVSLIHTEKPSVGNRRRGVKGHTPYGECSSGETRTQNA